MDTQGNTPATGLSDSDAISAIMGAKPSKADDPKKKRTPEPGEVTEPKGEAEEPVTTEEAAVRESQRNSENVDPNEQSRALTDDDDDADEADPDGDEAEEEDADEEEGDEDSEGTEAEDDDDADDANQVLFHDVDGNPVTKEEAQRGYLRQADYTRKTQELAQYRQQLGQVQQQVVQERQTLAQNLEVALGVLEPRLADLAKTDWETLSRKDPYAYAEKRALFDQARNNYERVVGEAQRLTQQREAERARQLQALRQREASLLAQAMPEITDPTKARSLKQRLVEYAVKEGLSESDAKNITNHKVIQWMEKARRYDELNESKLSVARKKVSKAPKRSIKAGQPVSAAQRKAKAANDQRARLKQTGKIDDALSLILR